MTLIYITTAAEANYRENAMKFNTKLVKMTDQQRTGLEHKKLIGAMIDILHRHLRNTN
jgi:hypothetical protein